MPLKLDYNAPVILTFALVCAIVYAIDAYTPVDLTPYVSIGGSFNFSSPIEYLRLFTHPIGHSSWDHILNNMIFVLLLGPIIEEKYGGQRLLVMMLVTALITAILNIIFFHTGLLGASGIVFMLIILASFANFRSGKIPITFILILVFFIGKEIFDSIQADNVSQFAHILGGICGSLFGFTRGLKG